MFFETYDKWIPISKKEYLKAAKKLAPKSFDKDISIGSSWEEVLDAYSELGFYLNYKREPIYPEVKGIFAQIKQELEDEPIGYKYYKRVGTEKVCFVGSEEAEIIQRLHLNMNNPKDWVRLNEKRIKQLKEKEKSHGRKQ